eukprot:NODE_8055_length_535_cov_8.586420_g7005_i0.p2 GENE.NODE_8055_length_535_cov_8.586420_g7005_i0~~NODE_8055_length_535_cov_8.586420_g7005_i0.p2  ORF type:complete len:102 (+),score=23.36 NODE_8055_length_535_cov_8.586420_g7005_i0:186-491(+)
MQCDRDEDVAVSLSAEKQKQLRSMEVKDKMENELYLRKHPEIKTLLSVLVERVIQERPENVLDFTAQFFSTSDLAKLVTDAKARAKEAKTSEVALFGGSAP